VRTQAEDRTQRMTHQVWRKRQGIPWEAEQPKGFVSNAQHISSVGAIANFPKADPEDLTEAFGWRGTPKLVRAIEGSASGPEKGVVRRKAIDSCLTMKGAANIAALLTAGVIPALNKVCSPSEEPDSGSRAAALAALERLAREFKAREEMLAHGTLMTLNGAAVDGVLEVRLGSLKVVVELARHRECMHPLVEAGFVKLLNQRCISAPDGGTPSPVLQAVAVSALSHVVQAPEGLDEAINVGAVKTTVGMLDSAERDVVTQSAFCVAALTHGQDEKAVALENGVMRKAVNMLNTPDAPELYSAAAAVLMSMCNGTRNPDGSNACKSEAVKEGVVQALVPHLAPGIALEKAGLMDPATSALTVYITKAMSSIADAPKGRKYMKKAALADLKLLAQSSEPLVQKNALIAIERIEWEA